ncbi:trans-sialidase [Trypanosoma conorhini]|uniref:Trans-sialidase n=1 Tax=Trypanosoma conorhini TaxID=83891 RepID=A0A422N090_9TRYP|nr:trans-sialidase [Trypanosoma conorhini]RNE98874.1 trans-sialidase [Trypanosoma conorhini]
MPRRQFFSAVLLLFFVCCRSGSVQADGPAAPMRIDPFAGTALVSGAKWEEVKPTGGSVCSLRVPSLVEVGGEVFAVAEAECKGSGSAGRFTGIASKLLKKSEEHSTEMLAADAVQFDTQLLRGGKASGGEAKDVLRPTTIVHGRDVYVLLGKYSRAEPANQVAGKATGGCCW